MTLPREAEMLGANSGELEIKGSGAHTIVRLSADAQRKLSARLSETKAAVAPVYLGLENIRGTFDAAVLTAYINLPENSRPSDHPNLMAESVGLYGLRMASVRREDNAGEGLTFIVEIIRILTELFASKSLDLEEIRVSILPDHPLPDSVTIRIGRVTIFVTSPT
jgi:tyrosinase